ncbi:MAG: HDOD domain-containing protein [Verrucomicrobiota bacterium]|nr:HDOD domain-containing protein [Verrucomicrobiota bacterium]
MRLQVIIPKINHLPPSPQVLPKLQRMLHDPCADSSEVMDLIRADSSLTAELLRLSNSATYARVDPVTSLDSAINLLGFKQIYRAAAQVICKQSLGSDLPLYNLKKNALLQQSICAACVMEEFAAVSSLDRSMAYTLGLLHVCGKVVVQYAWNLKYLPLPTVPPTPEVEKQQVSFNYAEAGAALMQFWKFPEEIGLIIKAHVAPESSYVELIQATHLHLAAGVAPYLLQKEEARKHIPNTALFRSAKITANEWEAILTAAQPKAVDVLKNTCGITAKGA